MTKEELSRKSNNLVYQIFCFQVFCNCKRAERERKNCPFYKDIQNIKKAIRAVISKWQFGNYFHEIIYSLKLLSFGFFFVFKH